MSQIPASVFRYLAASSEGFYLKEPMQAYLDFFWSPMMTVFIVWLFEVYVARFCVHVDRIVKNDEVYAYILPHRLAAAVALGVAMAHIAIHTGACNGTILRVFTFLAIAMTSVESVASRYILHGKTSMLSFTVFWFFGTWLYFLWRYGISV